MLEIGASPGQNRRWGIAVVNHVEPAAVGVESCYRQRGIPWGRRSMTVIVTRPESFRTSGVARTDGYPKRC